MAGRDGVSSERYQALDGLRGLCAMMVVLFHGSFNSHLYGLALIRQGWLFVDFFFVLSGFIIADVYGSKIREGMDFLRFVGLRLGRLYPLHLFVLSLYMAYEICWWLFLGQYSDQPREAFSDKNSLEGLFLSLTLLNAMGILDYLVWNTPSWSIGAEFYTYLVFGLIMLATGRKASQVLILVAVMSLMWCATAGPYEEQTYNGFFRCLAGFSLGSLLRLSGRSFRNGSVWVHSAIEGAAILLATLFVLDVPPAWHFTAPFAFIAVVWAFVPQAGLFSQLICSPAGQTLGALSYSIYMVHVFLLQIISNLASAFGVVFHMPLKILISAGHESNELIGLTQWQGDVGLLFYVGAVVGFAMLTYRFVEVPSRQWSRVMIQRRLGLQVG